MHSKAGAIPLSLCASFCKGLKPKQHLYSHRFLFLISRLAANVSYRTAIGILTETLPFTEDDVIKRSTYEERIEATGLSLANAYNEKSEAILKSYGIDTSGIVSDTSSIPKSVIEPSLPPTKTEKELRFQIREYNRGRLPETKIRYSNIAGKIEESADRCCYVSIDDILVKHQKDNKIPGYKKEHKFISKTVVNIQYEGKDYTITAPELDQAMKLTFAYLLINHLLEDSRLIFFSDGATCIFDAIRLYFSFREYTVILDWFHLKKKCDQYLSMGIKGSKKEKNEIKDKLVSILWSGNVGKAIQYIKAINKKNVKNKEQLDMLVGYMERKKTYIPCYAMRKKFGLRNSSNPVEKDNDRVVAVRQKNNGMSWSEVGSNALAIITAADIGNELYTWIFKRTITFEMAA